MAKKELPDKKLLKDSPLPKDASGISGDFSSKISGLSSKAFGIIKFILGIVLLPFVFSTAVSFLNEFGLVSKDLQAIFWSGTISFLVIYLFILIIMYD